MEYSLFLDIFTLIISLALLYLGAELSLSASEKFGTQLGLSPLIIGMVLIGIGTSLPELFVSQIASYNGKVEISLGNILGSNVANIFLILAIAGFLKKLSFNNKSLRDQLVIHAVLTITLGLLLLRGRFDLLSGLILIAFLIAYLLISYHDLKKSDEKIEASPANDSYAKLLFYMLIGFSLLAVSSELLVNASSSICRSMGISEYVISAIFIAFGTSFPELITTVVACMKNKDTDIIIGNVVGSNIFNISLVLGSISFYGFDLTRGFSIEMIALLVASCYFLILFYQKKSLHQKSALFFITSYLGIVVYWLNF